MRFKTTDHPFLGSDWLLEDKKGIYENGLLSQDILPQRQKSVSSALKKRRDKKIREREKERNIAKLSKRRWLLRKETACT